MGGKEGREARKVERKEYAKVRNIAAHAFWGGQECLRLEAAAETTCSKGSKNPGLLKVPQVSRLAQCSASVQACSGVSKCPGLFKGKQVSSRVSKCAALKLPAQREASVQACSKVS